MALSSSKLKTLLVATGVALSCAFSPMLIAASAAEEAPAPRATKVKLAGFGGFKKKAEPAPVEYQPWQPPELSTNPDTLVKQSKKDFYASTDYLTYVNQFRDNVYQYFYGYEGADVLPTIQDYSIYAQRLEDNLKRMPKDQALTFAEVFMHVQQLYISQIQDQLNKRPELQASKSDTQEFYVMGLHQIKEDIEPWLRTALKAKNYDDSFFTSFTTEFNSYANLLQLLVLKENFCENSECFNYYMKSTTALAEIPFLAAYPAIYSDPEVFTDAKLFNLNKATFAQQYFHFLPLEAFSDNYPRVY